MSLNLQQVLNKTKILIKEQKWEEIKQLIFTQKLENSNHVDIINMLANLYVMENDLKQAEKVIQRGLIKHEYNLDVNYNAGVIYDLKQNYEKSLYYFLVIFELTNGRPDEQVYACIEKLQKIIKKSMINNIHLKVQAFLQRYYVNFPQKESMGDSQSYVGQAFCIQEEKYYVGEYKYGIPGQYTNLQAIPVEIFKAKEINTFEMDMEEKTTIPIMVNKVTKDLEINYNSETVSIPNISRHKFRYFTFPKGAHVKISDTAPFMVANPICHALDTDKPKLVLNIYIDSLSQFFLDEFGFEQVMPFTARFFQKGTVCTQSYAATEWTYPSVANLFTGKYTMEHRLFHPIHETKVLHYQNLFPQVLQKNGYFTTMIDCNWRSVPLLGYVKGFDRVRYQHNYHGSHAGQVIMEAIEQIQTFSNTNQFLSICLFDLHDISELLDLSLMTQVNVEAKYHESANKTVKSVNMSYDRCKVEQYKAQLQKIDGLLYGLYCYLEENYKEDEMLISLVSDHGLGFLKDSHNLDNHNVHIPMMFRGKNIPQGQCNELMQTVDLFPTILQALQLDSNPFTHDGNVPVYFGGKQERKYAFAESLFPNQPYSAIFYEKDIKIHFKTKENTTNDGRIDGINGFYGKIFDVKTDREIKDMHSDKLEYYGKVLFNHIQEYLL